MKRNYQYYDEILQTENKYRLHVLTEKVHLNLSSKKLERLEKSIEK